MKITESDGRVFYASGLDWKYSPFGTSCRGIPDTSENFMGCVPLRHFELEVTPLLESSKPNQRTERGTE